MYPGSPGGLVFTREYAAGVGPGVRFLLRTYVFKGRCIPVAPVVSCLPANMLLALVLEFDSHRGDIFTLCAKVRQKQYQLLLRARIIVGRYNSTRVDEGRKC